MTHKPLIRQADLNFLSRLNKSFEAQKDAIKFTKLREPNLMKFVASISEAHLVELNDTLPNNHELTQPTIDMFKSILLKITALVYVVTRKSLKAEDIELLIEQTKEIAE